MRKKEVDLILLAVLVVLALASALPPAMGGGSDCSENNKNGVSTGGAATEMSSYRRSPWFKIFLADGGSFPLTAVGGCIPLKGWCSIDKPLCCPGLYCSPAGRGMCLNATQV